MLTAVVGVVVLKADVGVVGVTLLATVTGAISTTGKKA